ncbi:MAG: ATP-binding protein [Clostridium sp.]|uniref:HAMP domain-containing sensor histidine kinase n=2 Tax=Clostridium sp. TaxID=1506 RepID=UPI001EB22332|nr:sensor histidine kinase [Clostridium sp.]MBS5885051.1 HAMP domain-containing protein [Clostridium sp.]MDU7148547.1 ATP-binding protein [Clostridium sp.]
MLTIRRKFGIVLGFIFILSILFFNLIMDKFFDRNFKDNISKDMSNIYKVSAKNLEDYIAINSIEKEKMLKDDFNNKVLKFIVERVNCQGVFYSLDGEVLATGIANEKVIDLNILKEMPFSFDLAKNNKSVVDIESKNGNILGKLSSPIYGKDNENIGILVLIKDYSNDYLKNRDIKNIVNIIVLIVFLLVFISIYFLSSAIIRPIIILKDKLSEISIGSYPEKINKTSKDEIGVLIDSFNNMSEKLKLKDEQEKNIFRNITHELKTPLTNISGYAQILREDDFNDGEFKNNALDRIIFESNRMHDLAISLLDISKQSSDIKEYAFEEVNLKNIIEELIHLQLPKIKDKNLKIESNISEEYINGNKQYSRMMFSNLIDNGIKYSSNSTTIAIDLKEIGSNIEFSILSKGKVIPHEMKEKIFEPFVKVEQKGFSSKDSNGLGLYICRNIVTGHKGTINVNLNGDETKFIVKLPKVNNLEIT